MLINFPNVYDKTQIFAKANSLSYTLKTSRQMSYYRTLKGLVVCYANLPFDIHLKMIPNAAMSYA